VSGKVQPIGTETRMVGVILEWRRLDNPWVDHSWRPVQVLEGAPQSEPWTVLAEGEGWRHYFAGLAEVTLYRHESEVYQYNLESRVPAVWVFLRRGADPNRPELLGASLDPGEAHAHNDTGDDIVDAVPMPDGLRTWLADYVQRHPPKRDYKKRQRDRADPEALARQSRAETDGARQSRAEAEGGVGRSRLLDHDPLRQVPEDE